MKKNQPTAVTFAPLETDEIRRMSVLPVESVRDLRSNKLGGTHRCGTCGRSSLECHGHFGHIELPVEVQHPLLPNCRLKALAVPPTRMRLPNAEHDAPLTALLHRVIRSVDRYTRCKDADDKALASASEGVHNAVHAYFQSCSTNGAAGLCARMRGKQGTLRQTLMGWRVNSCARAVVAPDPCLAPWEVGVPRSIAQTLGLSDGNSVLLNRQPSLHKGSIMGHVVRIRDQDSCFSISPTVTPPYNADFDGDEMNLHVCSAESAADARILIGVENSLLSPAGGNVSIRLVQDACLSWYLRSGLNSKEQKKQLLQSCESEGQASAARRLHAEQLAAHDHMAAAGFSVGVDDFLDTIPVHGSDVYTLGDVASRAAQHVRSDNRIAQMVAAGSKGSVVNLAQLFGCVGYQTVQGQAAKHPDGGSAFISHSFVEGMTPHEFWMHASAAREGMIQTAVKTADTGYLMRRMVKTLENVTVSYDGTVRTAAGSVVQFKYGQDGVDPTTAQFRRPRQIEPGEAVGILCAQSIGEKLTQLTLDTFHKAGVAFRHGISRVKSLVDARGNSFGVLRGHDQQYRIVRCAVDDFIVAWERVDALPSRALLEMRMRGMTAIPHMRAQVCLDKLQQHGLQLWQLAARVREHCACVSDDAYIYAEKALSHVVCAGPAWASSVLVDDAVVLRAAPPALDTTSYCSEPAVVAQTLGIEAAAAALCTELSPYVQGVNFRHVRLLADAMTHTGELLGATRTGLRRADAISVLGRACFETGPQILADAASAHTSDPLHAASSRMAMGLVPRVGAHAVDTVHVQEKARVSKARPTFMDQPVAKRGRFGAYMNH